MKRTLLVAAWIVALFSAGCNSIRIAQITADPSRYRNQTVRITGTVTTSLGLLGHGGYQVEDSTGKIYVISSAGIPSGGSRVTVTGKVIPGAHILGQAVGTVIHERHHTVK